MAMIACVVLLGCFGAVVPQYHGGFGGAGGFGGFTDRFKPNFAPRSQYRNPYQPGPFKQSSFGGGFGGGHQQSPYGFAGPQQSHGGYASPHHRPNPHSGYGSSSVHKPSSGFPSGASSFPTPKFGGGNFGFGASSHKCEYGYRYSQWSGECKDVDECDTGSHACTADQICYNTKGSFACVPKPPCEKPTCASLGFVAKPHQAFIDMVQKVEKATITNFFALLAQVKDDGTVGTTLSGVGAVLDLDDCCLQCNRNPACVATQFATLSTKKFGDFQLCFDLGVQHSPDTPVLIRTSAPGTGMTAGMAIKP